MTVIKGAHIVTSRRLNNSRYGNPRFDLGFVDDLGNSHVYTTQSDAACSYDVENLVTEHRKDPLATVTVELTRALRVATLTRDAKIARRFAVDAPVGYTSFHPSGYSAARVVSYLPSHQQDDPFDLMVRVRSLLGSIAEVRESQLRDRCGNCSVVADETGRFACPVITRGPRLVEGACSLAEGEPR